MQRLNKISLRSLILISSANNACVFLDLSSRKTISHVRAFCLNRFKNWAISCFCTIKKYGDFYIITTIKLNLSKVIEFYTIFQLFYCYATIRTYQSIQMLLELSFCEKS